MRSENCLIVNSMHQMISWSYSQKSKKFVLHIQKNQCTLDVPQIHCHAEPLASMPHPRISISKATLKILFPLQVQVDCISKSIIIIGIIVLVVRCKCRKTSMHWDHFLPCIQQSEASFKG